MISLYEPEHYHRSVPPFGNGQQHSGCAFKYPPGARLIVAILVTVFAVALATGRTAVAEAMPDPAQLDARLRNAVTQSLNDYEQVKIAGLSVEVEAGIVTLEGKVATPAEKHLAARRTRNIIGVRGVVNAIDVDEALKLLR